MGRSSFFEAITIIVQPVSTILFKEFQGCFPWNHLCRMSRSGFSKIGKWYHFPLLANLYFDIPLRSNLVWSYTTTSRQIVWKWNFRQVIENKKLLANLARGVETDISLIPQSGIRLTGVFFKISYIQVEYKFKKAKRRFLLVDKSATS